MGRYVGYFHHSSMIYTKCELTQIESILVISRGSEQFCMVEEQFSPLFGAKYIKRFRRKVEIHLG